jgi:hypothetical protein
MTSDATARLHLYEQARGSWDEDAARTLMTALPWDVAELATKQDLEVLRHSLEAKIEHSMRTVIVSTMVANAALAGAISIGVQLAG